MRTVMTLVVVSQVEVRSLSDYEFNIHGSVHCNMTQ